jgi:hypothetical protein
MGNEAMRDRRDGRRGSLKAGYDHGIPKMDASDFLSGAVRYRYKVAQAQSARAKFTHHHVACVLDREIRYLLQRSALAALKVLEHRSALM